MSTQQAWFECIKELARVAFFAGVTAVVGWGTAKLNLLDPTSTQYMIGIVVLRAIDSFVHNNAKIPLSTLSPTDVIANKIAES